jgi:hypothetical protein
MNWQETQTKAEERVEQALDRLGELIVPESRSETDFVARVMQQVRAEAPSVRGPRPAGRRFVRIVAGAAVCLVVSLTLWRISARQSPRRIVTNVDHKENVAPARLSVEAAPAVRKSTWSVVTEGVVLEDDMPVRKLLYREFERVEVLDSQGNPESSLVVPTKAMLVAGEERY